tara:strand:+ start:406 stop:930 length:525 start_codon:yes stop_codon:yes gene_type:complete
MAKRGAEAGMPVDDERVMDDAMVQFHLQEHRILRDDIYRLVADIRFVQRLVIPGGIAGLMWSYTQDPSIYKAMSVVAVVAGLFCLTLTIHRHRMVSLHAQYLRRIENVFRTEHLMGWENYLATRREGRDAMDGDEGVRRFQHRSTLFDIGVWVVISVVAVLHCFHAFLGLPGFS